jgi:hypothetical protein
MNTCSASDRQRFPIRSAAEIDITCAVISLKLMAAHPTLSFRELHPDKRLGELMLYIAKKSQFDQNFGSTKLNKILFYADFVSYATHITSSCSASITRHYLPEASWSARSSTDFASRLKLCAYGGRHEREPPRSCGAISGFIVSDD